MSDLGSLGWHTIFKAGGNAMSLPEELTRKWWDRKKQLIAKTHATGIGEQLDKLKPLFEKIEWLTLASTNLEIHEKNVETAKKLPRSGEMTAFTKQCRVIRDLAKEQAAFFRKGATKKTADVLEEIRETADQLVVACNDNSLGEALKVALEEWQKKADIKFKSLAGPTVETALGLNKKLGTAEGKMKDALKLFISDPHRQTDLEKKVTSTRGVLGEVIRSLCRDMTTQLGNLVKIAKTVPLSHFDEGEIEKLYQKLSPISDSKDQLTILEGLEPKQIVELVSNVLNMAKRYTALTEKIVIG